MVIAEYIWIGGNDELRSKTKVLPKTSFKYEENNIEALPDWNYDGSSTEQATGDNSEVIIKPVSVCKCPFRKEHHILVLCDTYDSKGNPLKNNHRVWAKSIFDKDIELGLNEKPLYGLEQEFFLINPKTNKPLGFPENGNPNPQGQYYCSVGASNAFGRQILEDHLEACLYAGLNISGINAEVAPGQWEYQIGPCYDIDAGDQLWLSRYILHRVAEKHGVSITFHPKPITNGEWNGSGCHTNYSTKSTRQPITSGKSGYKHILDHMKKLEEKHKEHMEIYGSDNELRMTGKFETASYDKFTYGVASRCTSVRIVNETHKNNCGYYEDRRPSSNIDPYLVTAKIYETTILL